MIPMHDYLIKQIAAARQADLAAEAANRQLVTEARAARRTLAAVSAEPSARLTWLPRLTLWRRVRVAS